MKNLQKLMALLMMSTIIVSVMTSCEKDDDNDGDSKENTLKSTSWKSQTIKINPAIVVMGVSMSELSDMEDECDKDDYMTFKDGGILEYHNGTNLCEDETDETEYGQWKLSDDEKQLTITDIDGSMVFEIKELKSTSMILTSTFEEMADEFEMDGMEDLVQVEPGTKVEFYFVPAN